MIYIGLGSNLRGAYGCPQQNCLKSKYFLDIFGIRVIQISSLWTSFPVPRFSGPKFINAVAKCTISNNLNFNPNKIACAVIEPVLGEGGFIPASKSGMKALEHFCKENGILLVIDEVQTGYGRTGSFFATEQFDVEPDIITVAKSIAGGLPLSGVIGKSEVMDSVHIGGIGGTYSGNPLACVAALEVLDIMESEKLSEKANEIGIAFRTKIDTIINKIPWVKEIRGVGAMMAIEIFDPDSGEPDKDRTNRIHQYALEHGLIMITAGTYGNIIRTLMPLNIDKATLSEGLEILCDALMA